MGDPPRASGETSPASERAVMVDVRRVFKVFSTRDDSVPAVADCSISARRGEFLSVVGPSGCGKSTLLTMIAGLMRPSSGEIFVDERRVDGPVTEIGIAFQSAVLLPWRSALGNVLMQLEQRHTAGERVPRAMLLLESVGLRDFAHRLPRELSGGMQQRVALCRALVHDPPLLLMDEPYAALDALTRDQLVLDLQRLWMRRRPTVIFVTHNLDEAVFLSDRVAVMTPRPGRIERLFSIDLPRPRRFAMRSSPAFGEMTGAIRELFFRNGLLKEDEA